MKRQIYYLGLVIVIFLVSCKGFIRKKELLGSWEVSEVVPEEGWEVLNDKELKLEFFADSMFLIHGADTKVFDYNVIDNKLILDETKHYGQIIDFESETMTISLNKSKFSFVFERQPRVK